MSLHAALHSSASPCDERVADAVEPILPQPVLPRDGLVDQIRPHVQGHASVGLGVEAGDVDGAGQLPDAAPDDLQAGRVVQR